MKYRHQYLPIKKYYNSISERKKHKTNFFSDLKNTVHAL